MPDPHDRQLARAALVEQPSQQQVQEQSALARHGDPSLQRRKTDGRYVSPEARQRGGIEWVRVSDLFTRGGIRLGDKSANSQESTVRKLLRGMASINPVSRRGIARKSAGSLPPPSVFGQTPPPQGQAVAR